MASKAPKVDGKQGNLVIENVAVEDLLPYARNSRVHSDYQVNQIAASIKEFGFCNPVLVDEEGTIIAGHGRVLAVLKLGWATLPAIRLRHLSETQRKAYVIADNQLPANASWDKEMLKLELQEIGAEGFNLDVLGFDKPKLDDILGTGTPLDLSSLVGGTGGEGEGGAPAPAEPAGPGTVTSNQTGTTSAASHVRMVQLFLDDVSQPIFLDRCAKLQEIYGTETLTDTVIEAVRQMHEQATVDDET